jgi:hypothetical protein
MENVEVKKVKLQLVDIDDPVANATEWEPVNWGCASTQTQEIHFDSDRIVVSVIGLSEVTAALVFGFFKIVGVSCFLLSMFLAFKGEVGYAIFLLIIAFISSLAGWVKKDREIFIIDLVSGNFGIGKDMNNLSIFSKKGHVKDIYAIQLLESQYDHDSESVGPEHYMGYEINFVLKNSQRVNVMAHGDLKHIIYSVNTISKVLKVPIWRANCSEA